MQRSFAILIVAALLCSGLPGSGAAAEGDSRGTVVSLSAAAGVMMSNDQAVVHYRIEASGANSAALQGEVNALARRISQALQRHEGLLRQTVGRSLQPMDHYDKAKQRQVRDGWRLVQREQVIGHDLQDVAGWVEDIERAGGHLDGISFSLSEAAAEEQRQVLYGRAVASFRERAADLAEALGATSYRILRLDVDGAAPPPMPRPVMALRVGESAPSLNGGESRLSVHLSGEILVPGGDVPVPAQGKR